MKYKILFIAALAALVSCKTTRTVTKTTEVQTVKPIEQVIENIKKAQPNFTSANIKKMSIEVNVGERKVTASATCKIQKDSLIHLSVQPFMGIELFKAEFSTDSIRVFDKMNHRYYVADYTYLKNRFGVDVNFKSLQALIFSQYLCIGKKEINSEGCTLTPLSNNRNRIDYGTDNLTQSTEISSGYNIEQILLKGKEKPYQLKLIYSDFVKENEINYPQKISLNISNGTTDASSIFSILKVEFNVPIKFSATDPSKYTKADIDQILAK